MLLPMIISFLIGFMIGLLIFGACLIYANHPLLPSHDSLVMGLTALASFAFGIFLTYVALG